MRRPFVAGNWKMNGCLASNKALLADVLALTGHRGAVDVVLCAPFPYLAQVADLVRGTKIGLGAQSANEHASGAYTGEVSVAMLADLGCSHVIVGHSERRALYGESDDVVAAKFAAVMAGGLAPILCVGETLAERDGGRTEAVVGRQLEVVMAKSGVAALAGAVLAYEPVWAIGTGRTATPEQAQAVHAFLRSRVAGRDRNVAERLRILYGGSVKAANAASIFAMPDVDGGLIGGASLVAAEFSQIVNAAG